MGSVARNRNIDTTEHHMHHHVRWMCKATTPADTTHAADRLDPTNNTVFQLDAGNLTWGTWTLLFGSEDTPIDTGMFYYDPHLIFVISAERTAAYILQFANGLTGDAALSAGEYSELVYKSVTAGNEEAPVALSTDRHRKETLLWGRCFCVGQNTGTIDFYIGVHEYMP